MKVKEYFNITKEELESKQHNILLPICVGNRFFLNKTEITENVPKYMDWALKNTKDKILILIVDKIQISNWVVRNKNNTFGTNLRRLTKLGKEIKSNFEEFVKELPTDKQKKIKIIDWEEYDQKDAFCSGTTRIIYQEFKNNEEFQKEILKAVKDSILDRKFKEKQYWKLCDYLLDEFAAVYHGVKIDGIYYGVYPYPDIDSALILVEDIKKGLKFKKLSEKLSLKKMGVVILK